MPQRKTVLIAYSIRMTYVTSQRAGETMDSVLVPNLCSILNWLDSRKAMTNQGANIISAYAGDMLNGSATRQAAAQVLCFLGRFSINFVALRDQIVDSIALDEILHQFGSLFVALGNSK